MFYKTGIPKYSEAANGALFSKPFVIENLRWLLLIILLNSQKSISARVFYEVSTFKHTTLHTLSKK